VEWEHASESIRIEVGAVFGHYENGQRPEIRLSDGSRLDADRYVFACGPWLGQLFPDVIGSRVEPTRQEVIYFGTPAGDERFIESRLPVWVDAGDCLIYGIPGISTAGSKSLTTREGPRSYPTNGDRTPSPISGTRFARS
jgi:sarcosine oxidase